ncbi:hypothetical protein cyc_00338 [Cyclospora cayetanensis]|uniref:WW domain-containing protein n=1 Tax=Cyclospora cayetanensis TaxID=88456 RepID=A0A1D3CTE3_9EIME|nr:hypothetical protein cyc_00338 [Cyclospora cayetanensis]
MTGSEGTTEQANCVTHHQSEENLEEWQPKLHDGKDEECHVSLVNSWVRRASKPLVSAFADPLHTEGVSSAPKMIPASESVLATYSGSVDPGSRSESQDHDGARDEDVPEISADSIAAAASAAALAATDAGELQSTPSSEDNQASATKQSSSDMPPPSFLPRQLRMKRSSSKATRNQISTPAQTPITDKQAVSVAPPSSAHSTDNSSGHATALTEQQKGKQEQSENAQSGTSNRGNVDDEFMLFMKEIQQLDSHGVVEADSATEDGQSDEFEGHDTQSGKDQSEKSSQPVLESLHDNPNDRETSQQSEQEVVWQAVLDAASGKTYYWNVVTDEVTWELPSVSVGSGSTFVGTQQQEQAQHDLWQWASSNFRMTQDLPTCSEKVQQLMLQLDFIEEELDAVYECSKSAHPAQSAEEAHVRSLASSLARRLGKVEKEWASTMLAALKARLDDWIDGGLSGSFFLLRLDKMQQEFQVAAASASPATKATPRNCLAAATAVSSLERGGSGRISNTLSDAEAVLKVCSNPIEDSPAACVSPPTPAGPPPTLPDDAPPATADVTQGGATPAAGMSLVVSRDLHTVEGLWMGLCLAVVLPTHSSGVSWVALPPVGTVCLHIALWNFPVAASAVPRDGVQAPGLTGLAAKRTISGSGAKKMSSSNPLVRKRMQLVEKWQKSREKDEESEEEDYEQRKERLKQKKLDEWKEREMARPDYYYPGPLQAACEMEIAGNSV